MIIIDINLPSFKKNTISPRNWGFHKTSTVHAVVQSQSLEYQLLYVMLLIVMLSL